MRLLVSVGVTVALFGCSTDEDPYLWLEDVAGDDALKWAEERNDVTRSAFADDPEFEPLEQRLRGVSVKLGPGSEDRGEPCRLGRVPQRVFDSRFGIENGVPDVEHPGDIVAVRRRLEGCHLVKPTIDLLLRRAVGQTIKRCVAGKVVADAGNLGQRRVTFGQGQTGIRSR